MKTFDEDLNARLNMENWDPANPKTCPSCLMLMQWFAATGQKVEDERTVKV